VLGVVGQSPARIYVPELIAGPQPQRNEFLHAEAGIDPLAGERAGRGLIMEDPVTQASYPEMGA